MVSHVKIKRMKNSIFVFVALISIITTACKCSKSNGGSPQPPVTPGPGDPVINQVDFWLTRGNQSVLLQKQSTTIGFTTTENSYPNIYIDSATAYQQVDGFGYTLTGGSAMLINQMNATAKASLIKELFDTVGNGIGINYLRLGMGASDLSPAVFSYNDLPAGQTDLTLNKFDLAEDKTHLIPVLKQILAINPHIKIMGTPWSPPTWMKDNGNSIGGKLKPEYYSVYANYFVKYIQAMKAEGITIDAVTIQNEPQHDGNNPSMRMEATEQRDFIKNHLGPAFQTAAINTKIIIWDHNCDNPNYPITILNDPDAKKYIDGSAFHLYAGDINALSTVKAAHADKNLYFTEQWTSSTGDFGGDLKWHLRNVIIGSMRNWSKTALEWNLANDPSFGPHTPGGCTQCKGALTISGSTVTKNVAYYIIAHASKFVPTGSTRISSTHSGNILSVAFKRADGKKVLIVLNDNDNTSNFNIRYNNKLALTSLPGGSVGTYIW